MKFIVLGAGLSGLTGAVALRRHGHEVTLVEKESAVGGLARSYGVDGYVFDYGPHFLFGQRVYDLVRNEFPEIELKRVNSTNEKMFFQQRYFDFPFNPKSILLHMEKQRVPGVLFELFLKNIFRGPNTNELQSVEDWVVQAVGRRIYDYVSLGGYVQKLYGLSPTEISHEWGIQKLKFLTRWHDASFMKLVAKSLSEEREVKNRVVYYPMAGGIDHIPLRMLETYLRLGGEILLNSEAVSIQHRRDGVSLELRRNGGRHRLDGDFLISTIPITQLVSMVSPKLPEKARRKVASLRYRTLLLLYLFVRREWALKHQCIYFTEDPFLFRRITEFKHLDESMTPPGRSSLCVEITCFDNDEVYHREKEELLQVVVTQLERGGYLKGDDLEGHHFLQVPFAYPVYEIQYGGILEEILSRLSRYRNVISIGRQGLFFYNAMNSSIVWSHELSRRLSVSGRNEWGKIIEETYQDRIAKYRLETNGGP